MQGDAAAGKLVDCRQLSCEQCRRREAGPLRDQDVKPVGHAEHMLADLQAIRRGGVKRQQHPIEAGVLMGFRHRLDMVAVEHRPVSHNGLRRIVVADVSDEFH